MARYRIDIAFRSAAPASANVSAVANMFGLGLDTARTVRVYDRLELQINPGDLVFVTGASGSGKSLLLRLLADQMSGWLDLADVTVGDERAIVDCFDAPLSQSLRHLSLAGLSDAFAILRSYNELSDGQRYRLRLALAMQRRPRVLIADEFCATLDRITAAVIAYNVRKFAKTTGTTVIVATSHDDLIEDLDPDVVVVKHLGSRCDVHYAGCEACDAGGSREGPVPAGRVTTAGS